MKTKLIFVNPSDSEHIKGGKAEDCGCRLEVSDGGGFYADVYTVTLCQKHKEDTE